MKFIEQSLAALAWLQVFVSPAIIGIIAGGLIWLALRGPWGIGFGLTAGMVGCIAGVVFAEKVRRTKGTIEFMARNIAHPELREKENN